MELETDVTASQIENKRWAKSHIISIQATGEVSWPPDLLQFNMMISSTKDSLEAAQGSVKRRTDYILQVLRNNGIKDHDIKCSTEIIRGEQIIVYTDILVGCGSAAVCEQVRNKLIEKLDSSVQFSDVACQHTLEARANKRQEAFKKAISNAKAKAESIAQTVGVQLGPAVKVVELSENVQQEPQSQTWNHPQVERPQPNHFVSLHQKVINCTVTYTSQVSTIFEVQPLRTCQHKKCSNKHS